MQPSTHVTHMPEAGTTEPSVRFLVRVAAEEFTFESDIWISPLRCLLLANFTGDTRRHVTHQIVELRLFQTRRPQVGAGAADRLFRLVVSAAKLAGGTDIHAAAAQAADLGRNVEGRADAAVFAAPAEADRLGHHLFRAHAHAQAAQNAIFVLLAEALPADIVGRRQVLNDLCLLYTSDAADDL